MSAGILTPNSSEIRLRGSVRLIDRAETAARIEQHSLNIWSDNAWTLV